VEDLVPNAHQHGGCLSAVATAAGLLHHEYGPEPPPGPHGRWAPLPSVLPIIEWRQTTPPFVVVMTDRAGADLYGFRRERPDLHREAAGGEDPHLTRSKPGGWAQRRYQERAENHWQERAEDVAKATVRLAEQIDARVIVAAGETRALQLLREALPKEALDILQPLEGQVGEGRTVDELRDEFGVLARAVADQDTAGLIEGWREHAGREDRATNGARPTVRALARAQVDALLLVDDPDDARTGWFGPEPTDLALDPADLRDTGVNTPTEGRLLDVLARAALGTGAGARIVPREAGIRDGVGAVLRWSD
jgi:hypothetical protein